jgi:hypothetical protein
MFVKSLFVSCVELEKQASLAGERLHAPRSRYVCRVNMGADEREDWPNTEPLFCAGSSCRLLDQFVCIGVYLLSSLMQKH